MASAKLEIGLFDGSNWATWKFKIRLLLQSNPGTLDAVEGKLQKPTLPGEQTEANLSKYKNDLQNYLKTDSTAMLLLTTNMSDDILTKVMRFMTAKEMWDELNHLYERASEDRSYEICMQFFKYKKDPAHDIGSHLSFIKNIWHDLKQNLVDSELPDILLICKILDSLPEQFFNFKSSWLLISKQDRTIENLTTQLCAYERALSESGENNMNALMVQNRKNKFKKKYKFNKCKYCGADGHIVKQCKKWIADGRPPKPSTNPKQSTNNTMLTSIALAFGENIDKDAWYIDNGATSHVTNRSDLFQTFEYFNNSQTVITANGHPVEAIGKGTIHVEVDINNKKEVLFFTNVWYVPGIQRNLFSVLAAQDLCHNSIFESSTESCYFKINGKVKLIGFRKQNGGLYKLKLNVLPPKLEINLLTVPSKLQLYHERLGHQNKRHVKQVIQRELGIQFNFDVNSEICQGCIYGKAHRLKFGTRQRATRPGELIHTDVCGPFVYSISKYRYFIIFKDDFTRFRYIFFLRHKFEIHARLNDFLAEAKTSGHAIEEILSDNGGEFDNEQIRNTLRRYGIRQRMTMPYTPEQNGCAERENRTVVEMARSLMHAHNDISQGLWAEIINTSVYILNRTGPTTIEGKSPYELWWSKKPKISHLRIVGCTCYVHIPKQRRPNKLDRKAQKGILVGYDGDDGYRIFDKENLKLWRSRDVSFEEVPLLDKNEPNFEIPGTIKKSYELPTTTATIPPDSQVEAHSDNDYQSIDSEDETDNSNDELRHEQNTPDLNRRVLRDRSQIKPPKRFSFDQFINEAIADTEPSSYREAIQSTDRDMWIKAMDSEINSLRENDTWDITSLPKNRKALRCKWIYKIKRNPDGSIDKYKARLVAIGYSQKEGIDYNKTFSPVAKLSTIRILLSIAANEGLSLRQFDVSTAFLYGTVKEEIYTRQPKGYNDGTSNVCRLKKSLYGLKQAPKCWNECIHNFLIETGFLQSDADPCLYVLQRYNVKMVLALYVDDGLIASSDDFVAKKFIEEELGSRFKITTKQPSYFLGLEINHSNNGTIKVHQTAYTKKILDRFGMTNCKEVGTPAIKDVSEDEIEKDETYKIFPYRQAVGALSYLMVGTRPDIAYAVGVVSRNLDKPSARNIVQVKRIFRYLKGTIGNGLEFKKNEKRLVCYSDADLGGDSFSGCSTSGMICMFGGSAISWRSTKQTTVALSSTEAEIIAASEACREIMWLQRLFTSLGKKFENPILRIDNQSAIKLAHNPSYEYHRKTKHIMLKHFYIRQCVAEDELVVGHVSAEDQLADFLTKPVFKPKLLKTCKLLGLQK